MFFISRIDISHKYVNISMGVLPITTKEFLLRTSHPAGKEPKKPSGKKFKYGRKRKFYDKHPDSPVTLAWHAERNALLREVAASL